MKKNIRKRLKLIKFLIFCFVFLLFIAFFIGLNTTGNRKNGKIQKDELEEVSSIIPIEFSLSEKDYVIERSTVLDGVYSAQDDIDGDESSQYTPERMQNLVDIPNAFSTEYDTTYGGSVASVPSDDTLSQRYYTNALERALDTLAHTRRMQNESSEHQNVERGRTSGLFVGMKSIGGGGTAPNLLNTMTDQLSNSLASLNDQLGAEGSQVYENQNAQAAKQKFLNEQQRTRDYTLQNEGAYADENALLVISGSVIPIILVTAINSDLPGFISARVTEDVYDTFWGTQIVIPKGTMVIGNYDSAISWGQNRLLVTWHRLSRPDGYSIQLEGMQGIDKDGSAGARGVTQTHIGKSIAASVLTSLFGVGSNYSAYRAEEVDDSGTLSQAIESTSMGVGSGLQKLGDKFLNRQPTIYIQPGTKSYIFVSKDIVMPAYTAGGR